LSGHRALPVAMALWPLALLVVVDFAAATPTGPQHVLFVLVDDLGFADVSYHGRAVNASVDTPTIDDISASGVRLESYYVTQLCSPTRTSLLSGRYPYTIGMNAEVIVDGHPSCLPRNVSTIADRLQAAGWATAAYGKWDAGMTSWGCTPTCRGFDHFFGFYNAYNDYFTHHVGKGLDFRNDTMPVSHLNGSYFTELMTAEHIRWLQHVHQHNASQPTFAYFAHQANHDPLEVPSHYIRGGCLKISITNPSRRILCGMMAAVDDSLRNITEAYKNLGLWDRTVIIFSTDNGGNTDSGGSNYPLRGNKATTFEGGVRGVGWVGGGWSGVQRQSVSHAMIHVSDWYPTIVHGIAGLSVGIKADGTPPLDGISAWPSIVSGVPSSRTEMLLNLIPTGGHPNVPGQGAIRIGKWKLLHGHTCVWAQRTNTYGCGSCVARDRQVKNNPPWEQPLPITSETSPPFCPNGWTPPPESNLQPIPPPDEDGVHCEGEIPCLFTNSTLITGGTFLFNIEADPMEKHNVASRNPDVVQHLLARLQQFNATNIPQENAPVDPASNPRHFDNVWTPWKGDTNPAACDWVPPPQPQPMSSLDGADLFSLCNVRGWCSGPRYSGPALKVRVLLDGLQVANSTAGMHRQIAGNHGFSLHLKCSSLRAGKHHIQVDCNYPATSGSWSELNNSPLCTDNGALVPCGSDQHALEYI